MKKLLAFLIIISLLVLASPVSWTVTAQDATEEPPLEEQQVVGEPAPTGEPQQPMAEPTQEAGPTEEPTQEVIPTEEPTQEVIPIEEPTQEVVPTEEPTQEVVPTEEPTQEVIPTEEPTQEVVPTEEPTAEPTEEPTATPVPVTISHIVIRDAADGYGSMVDAHTMNLGEKFTVYAAAYDAEGDYLWDVPVNWSLTGSLVQTQAESAPSEEAATEEPAPEMDVAEEGDVEGEAADGPEEELVLTAEEPTVEIQAPDTRTTSFTFVPAAAGEGTIIADDGRGHVYETGLVTVVEPPKEPEISHIAIRDAADGFGSQVMTVTLTVSDTFVLYAAAYDIEGNYIKDVPATWTTTGTLDPITVTEAISMTFAPVTPNTSGTIVADDGAGRTDETGIIEVGLPMLASDVGMQLAGTWTTERIGIMNLGGTGTTATVSTQFYDANGNVQTATNAAVLNGKDGVIQSLPGALSNGKYSAVVSSDQPVAVLVHNSNYTSQASDVYVGVDSASVAQTLYFPQANCYNSDWVTLFHVQNVHSSAQNVTFDWYYSTTGAPPFAKYTATKTNLAPNASHTFDLGALSGTYHNKKGYAIITGDSGNIAAVAQGNKETDAANVISTNTVGFSASMADTELAFPVVFYDYSGFRSYLAVTNVSGSAADVELLFTRRDNGRTATASYPGLQPDTTWNVNLKDYLSASFRNNFVGTCVVTSANNVVAVASSLKYAGGAIGYNTAAASTSKATTQAAVPTVLRFGTAANPNNWMSSIQTLNLGASANVTVSFVRAQGCTAGGAPFATFDSTQMVGNNNNVNFNLNQIKVNGQNIPSGWYGVAYVSSSSRILVTCGATHYGSNVAYSTVAPNY